jgi:PleD family two-component response regulator
MTQTCAFQPKGIRVLLVEDSPTDARLMQETLLNVSSTPYELIHVDQLAKAKQILLSQQVDLVLLDISLPDSHGLQTFLRIHGQAPDVPVVVITGLDDEALGFRSVQEGAQDYLVKGQVTASLLARSMRYAIERERLLRQLREALAKIKTLRGLLPICASCKKIRDDQGYWNQIESYVMKHSEADFTHSICPGCVKTLYPELLGEKSPGLEGKT